MFSPQAQAMADSAIAKSLKATRERLGWSRETLAHHSGISWSAIAQIESGRRGDVRLSSLSALARALGVTIDYLGGSAPAAGPPPLLEHRVLRYGSDDEFVASVVPFLRQGIERSESVLAVSTRSGLKLIRDRLGDQVGRAELAEAEDWYSSPAEALERYRDFIDASTEAGFPWVRIVGEPVWTGSAAEIRKWSRYESILNLSLAGAPATIICPYDTRSVPKRVLLDAGCTHPESEHPEGSVASPSYRDPEDFLL
jgi:transcriptional regulator with XRE-family HTH domain